MNGVLTQKAMIYFGDGSCAGIAISTMHFKNNFLNPSYWQAGVEKEYDLNYNNDLSYMINFYQVFQGEMRNNIFTLMDINGEYNIAEPYKTEVEGFYKGVKGAYDQNSNQILLCDFFWPEGGLDCGHSVIIIGGPQTIDDEVYEYRIPIYDSNYEEEHYIYIKHDMEGVSVGSKDNYNYYGVNSGASSGNNNIYKIDAYSLNQSYNIQEKLQNYSDNEGKLLEFYNPDMEVTTKSSVKISDNQGKTVSIAKEKRGSKEGDLQCKVYPVICDNLEQNREITRNSIGLEDQDWYSIETENDTDKLDADIQFGDSYMKVLTQAGGKAEFENKKSVKLSNYSGQEYEMKLTLNNEFKTLPWYTITVDGTGTKEAKLEMVEKGAIISGDDLKNITVKGNDSKETVELGISTDKDKVLITANNDKTKLLAYVDTDGDGSFETLLEDKNDNSNNNQDKTDAENKTNTENKAEEKSNQKENITNAQTGDQIVLMVITLLVAVIALACTVVIKHIIR